MSHEGIRFASKQEQAQQEAQSQPLPRIAVTPDKVRVLLTEGKGLEIDWQDGHRSAWAFNWLREACPCATCVDQRNQEGRKPGEAKPKNAALLAHVHATAQAGQRACRGPLRNPVQLAGRP